MFSETDGGGGSFSGSHDDLTDVDSDDHHTKTTSSSDLTDVSADSVSDAHHTRPSAGDGLTESANTFSLNAVASGSTALSSGVATVSTGVSATSATFMVALGVSDPDADCEVGANILWDDSAGEHVVEINERDTAVGNPTVNYDIIRVS